MAARDEAIAAPDAGPGHARHTSAFDDAVLLDPMGRPCHSRAQFQEAAAELGELWLCARIARDQGWVLTDAEKDVLRSMGDVA